MGRLDYAIPVLDLGAVSDAAKAAEQAEDRFGLAVVYSPNKMPKRGADGKLDVASPRVLERAAWAFMERGAQAGLMHATPKKGSPPPFRVVENYIYRNPVPWVMRAVDGSEVTVRQGDWLVGFICSPAVWADLCAGRYGGLSLDGTARRKPASAQTLAHQRS